MTTWFIAIASLFVAGDPAEADLNLEPTFVAVPGEGWLVEFSSPPLARYAGTRKGENFEFRAAGDGGFNLSIFVEAPEGPGKEHQDCYKHYWPLAKRNPMIDQKSVKVTKADDYVKVAYEIVVGEGDDALRAENVNYYFAHEGRWVDVHVSLFPPSDRDAEILRQFEQSLSRRPNKSDGK